MTSHERNFQIGEFSDAEEWISPKSAGVKILWFYGQENFIDVKQHFIEGCAVSWVAFHSSLGEGGHEENFLDRIMLEC
jgi:hypothetical protein